MSNTASSREEEEEEDLNEMFDSIVMLEQKVAADGFREGYEKGQQEGTGEGYRAGHRGGMQIGYELGFYRGRCLLWQELTSQLGLSDKAVVGLERLKDALDKFPTSASKDTDVNIEMDKVRSAYKKTCSLMNVPAALPGTVTLSF